MFKQYCPFIHLPFISGIYYSKEEIKKITLDYNEQVNRVSDKYNFKDFIKVAMSCNVSLKDWLDLTPYARSAFVYDFNEIVEEQEASARKKESEQKMALKEMMKSNTKTKIGSDSSRLSIWR